MQTSYRDIVTFVNAAHAWLEKHEGSGKFRYALEKMLKRGTKLWADYSEKLQDLQIDHASVDKDKNLVKDARGEYVFTREAAHKFNDDRRALFEAETVEIEPYLSPNEPDDLTHAERRVFEGFVLPKAAEDDESTDSQSAELSAEKPTQIRSRRHA